MGDSYHMTWIGRHEGRLRDIARGVAYGDNDAIEIAAGLFASLLPKNCIIIPMPSHHGMATTMRKVCLAIEIQHHKGTMCDCLLATPHESCHAVKLRGEHPMPIRMDVDYEHAEAFGIDLSRYPAVPVFVLDNCISSGTTANAALAALPCATVFSITKG